jgi:hypothetical protein
MMPDSENDSKDRFKGPKSRRDLWGKLASGGDGVHRGRVVTKDLMNSRGHGSMIEVVDVGLTSPVTPADAVLYDILKRLRRMRDIVESVAESPMSPADRAKKQEEINQCRDEIDDLSNLLSTVATPEKKRSVDMSITQASDMIAGLLNDAVLEDTGGAESPEAPLDDEKLAEWMESIMKGWG